MPESRPLFQLTFYPVLCQGQFLWSVHETFSVAGLCVKTYCIVNVKFGVEEDASPATMGVSALMHPGIQALASRFPDFENGQNTGQANVYVRLWRTFTQYFLHFQALTWHDDVNVVVNCRGNWIRFLRVDPDHSELFPIMT